MANPSEFAREAFINNVLLVKALVLLRPPDERQRAILWADFLSKESSTSEEQAVKNEYMWYLLLVLQHESLKKPPFDKPPNPGPLKSLSYVLDKETYHEVLVGTKNEIYFHDTLKELQKRKMARDPKRWTEEDYNLLDHPDMRAEGSSNAAQKQPKPDQTHPAMFFQNQPRPARGAICYAAVFSDYADEK